MCLFVPVCACLCLFVPVCACACGFLSAARSLTISSISLMARRRVRRQCPPRKAIKTVKWEQKHRSFACAGSQAGASDGRGMPPGEQGKPAAGNANHASHGRVQVSKDHTLPLRSTKQTHRWEPLAPPHRVLWWLRPGGGLGAHGQSKNNIRV